jgi:hypothetical protein
MAHHKKHLSLSLADHKKHLSHTQVLGVDLNEVSPVWLITVLLISTLSFTTVSVGLCLCFG